MSKKKAHSPSSFYAPGGDHGAGDGHAYEVGRNKPPLHSRWQKGQSGNPGGRARDSLNLKTIASMLADELAELVSVQGPDGKRRMSKDRAFFKKVINDALTGGARDKKLLLDAMVRFAELDAPAAEVTGEAAPGGADALERYVDRALRRKKLEHGAPAEDDDDEEGSP